MVWVNRLLFLLLAALVVGVANLPRMMAPQTVTASRPAQVPTMSAPTRPDTPDSHAALPARNPWDSRGEAWIPEPVPDPAVLPDSSNGADEPVRGLIRLGPLKGALTEKSFIGAGQDLHGGRLDDVGEGRVLIWTPQGEREIEVNTARQNRLRQLFGEDGAQ